MSKKPQDHADGIAQVLPEPITLTPEQAKQVAAGTLAATPITTTTTGIIAPPPTTSAA